MHLFNPRSLFILLFLQSSISASAMSAQSGLKNDSTMKRISFLPRKNFKKCVCPGSCHKQLWESAYCCCELKYWCLLVCLHLFDCLLGVSYVTVSKDCNASEICSFGTVYVINRPCEARVVLQKPL